jgi:hypothetical protein
MKPKHPHRAGTHEWIVFLVTGPEPKLENFCREALVEVFDRRGQTLRCRAFGPNRGIDCYTQAVDVARKTDVSLQDLVVTGRGGESHNVELGGGASVTVAACIEEYPVVVLGSDQMKWGKR